MDKLGRIGKQSGKSGESVLEKKMKLYSSSNDKFLLKHNKHNSIRTRYISLLYTLSWTMIIVYCILQLVSGLWPFVV